MSHSLAAALLWFVIANVIGVFPSKRNHWPQAYVLIAVGLPVLVWVWIENGWIVAAVCLAAAVSILRWPVRYLLRWVRGVILSRQG